MPCADHVRVECQYCREITRQCSCMDATPKRIMVHLMCSACAKQMPPDGVTMTTEDTSAGRGRE